ncbi:MAG: AAA family ATPase [Desulfomonile tiedjei]|nr:AAA family ATPase [Desulfomonile tiedjei]
MSVEKLSARKILVDWANKQSNWVRAIVSEVLNTAQTVSDDAVDEIYKMLLAERGLSDEPAPFIPKLLLEEGDVDATERLTLAYIKAVEGVNLLASGQEIFFNPRMTVLFGENASGKSGYVRILKCLAAVRSAEKVLPNIKATQPISCQATVGYKVSDKEQFFEWQNETGIPPFTRASIFDTRAVALHVDQDLEYVYTPRDLALFPLVTDAIQAVKDRLTRSRDERRPAGNFLLQRFDVESTIYGKIEALGAATDLSHLEVLSDVSVEEAAQLQVLRNKVEALRATTITAQLQVARSNRDICAKLLATARAIAAFDWASYSTDVNKVRSAEQQYRRATEEAFAGLDLPGALSDAWSEFIKAGDAYLKYLGLDDYPDSGDRCIYCRQDLGEAALALLKKYQAYCNNTFQAQLQSAREEMKTRAELILDLDIRAMKDSLSERTSLVGKEDSLATTLSAGFQLITDCLPIQEQIGKRQAIDAAGVVARAATVVELTEADCSKAEDLIADLTKRGSERELAYAQANGELRELEARLTLRQMMPQVRDFVAKAKWASTADTIIGRFPQLQKSLTDASKMASEDLLNQDFSRFFEQERQALHAPNVKLEFPGRGGQAKRKKSLTPEHRLSDILSEGEQKVIALADFLAESAIRTVSAPLVFDDPVNSLDYKRLQYIVDRLHALSEMHQVIIFTHNIWFATSMLAKFEKTPDLCSYFDITHGEGEVTGIVTGGKHPRYDTPAKLRAKINDIIQSASAESGETQQALIESAYSRLRSWCEAVVEQDLLKGVTKRYQPNVMMTKLKDIHPDRLASAIEEIYRIFEKCCRITDAHSQPLETLNIRPTMKELREDWAAAHSTRDAYLA